MYSDQYFEGKALPWDKVCIAVYLNIRDAIADLTIRRRRLELGGAPFTQHGLMGTFLRCEDLRGLCALS